MYRWVLACCVLCSCLVAVANDMAPVDDQSTIAGQIPPPHAVATSPAVPQDVSAQVRALVEMDLPMQVTEMRQKISVLQGQLEQAEHTIATLQKQQQLLAQHELGSHTATPASSSAQSSRLEASEPAHQAGVVATESAMYQSALAHLQQRQYVASEQAFQDYLQHYPEGQYRANTYYWLGELQLVQGHPQAAAASFDRVLKQFPLSHKVPDAMLKKAMAMEKMGHAQEADQLYGHLIKQFPESSAARFAQQQRDRVAGMA